MQTSCPKAARHPLLRGRSEDPPGSGSDRDGSERWAAPPPRAAPAPRPPGPGRRRWPACRQWAPCCCPALLTLPASFPPRPAAPPPPARGTSPPLPTPPPGPAEAAPRPGPSAPAAVSSLQGELFTCSPSRGPAANTRRVWPPRRRPPRASAVTGAWLARGTGRKRGAQEPRPPVGGAPPRTPAASPTARRSPPPPRAGLPESSLSESEFLPGVLPTSQHCKAAQDS